MNLVLDMYLRSLQDIQVETARGQEADCHSGKN